MTESHNSGGFTKGRRTVLVGGCSVLALLIATFATWYYASPQSGVRFYYSITQWINIGAAGLLSDVPCAAPCVFGIQAGKTRLDEVSPLLKANGISKCFMEPSVSWILFSCGFSRFNVQVNAQTKFVNAIWYQPNTSISVSEIINKYGKPDYVAVYHDRVLEGRTIQMDLYWDSKRMSIGLPPVDRDVYAIDKSTRIETVDFSDEELYQGSSEIELGSVYKLWNGYNAYRP